MDKQIIGGEVVVGGNKIPLSKAIRAGDYVYLSGQVPLKGDGSVETGSIEAQTRVVMENIKEILGDAGCGLSDVIKATAWLADRADFAGFNRVYAEYFPDAPPTRSTVESRLMIDIRVEVEVTAYKPL
jgi:reactive intermediate/imine deaminase